MNPYGKYLKHPTESSALNVKLLILSHGLNVDFSSIQNNFPDVGLKYKVNQIRVSDRHLLSPQDESRKYIPDELVLKDKIIECVVKVYYRPDSPLVLRAEDKAIKILFIRSKKELPVDVRLVENLKYSQLEYRGHKLGEFVAILGEDRISILPFEGCEHWTIGEQCKFCGANPKRLNFRSYKHSVCEIKPEFNHNHKQWWQSRNKFALLAIEMAVRQLKKHDKLSPHTHLFILSGNLLSVDYLWRICLEVSKIVNKYFSIKKIDSYINLVPPKNLKILKEVKKIGFRSVCYNFEVIGKKRFKDVCPGKERVCGYNNMLKAAEYSVSLFGRGKIRSNFVLGVQPPAELIKGVKYLARKGIVSDYTVFFPRPGSAWRNKKPPSADTILKFTLALVKIYDQYNFPSFCCALSSRSSVANEVRQIGCL